MVNLVPAIERPDLIEECIKLINDEWPMAESSRRHMLNRNANPDPPMGFLMMDSEQQLIGYASFLKILNCTRKAALFETVVIRRDQRNKGYGRLLMNLLRDEAKRRDYELVSLLKRAF
jgi:GNAT superfamily N-acetyltransferase